MLKLLTFSLIIAALAAPPIVHLELLQPNLVVDGVHRELGLIAYQVAVEEQADWTDNMTVCYWTVLTESVYHASAEAVASESHCVEAPSGIIVIASFKCGHLQVYAAVLRRDTTAVNNETCLSTVATLAVSEPCTGRSTTQLPGWQQHAAGRGVELTLCSNTHSCRLDALFK
jgi:hypothetical protein